MCRLQGARYLFGMGPLPVTGHLSLSGTLSAWSGIGHAATLDIRRGPITFSGGR